MTRVEELFVIDPSGEMCPNFGQAEGDNRGEQGPDEIRGGQAKNARNARKNKAKSDSLNSDTMSVEELEDGYDKNDQSEHESSVEGLDSVCDGSPNNTLSNLKLFEKVRNMDDAELESSLSLELWNLYKELGPSIWPSFLRYENPPMHVKISESRFFLGENSDKADQKIVFANLKEDPDHNESYKDKYLIHINKLLKDLSDRQGFYSCVFNSVKSTRDGLINLYLTTNGTKKGVSIARCQFCGSSKCERKAKSCKANRCFKCLLKGHQIRDCTTKYGYFNQNLLLPARIERESIYSDRVLIENMFNTTKKIPDIKVSNAGACICLECNQTGHINCGNQAPMLSKGSKTKDKVSSSESRFMIFPEDANSTNQNTKNLYLKTNITIPSNKLFNISHLLEFTKSFNNNSSGSKRPKTLSNRFSSPSPAYTDYYPQSQPQFHHPNQFIVQNHNYPVHHHANPNYYANSGPQYEHFHNVQLFQSNVLNPNYNHGYPVQQQDQIHYYSHSVSSHGGADTAISRNNFIDPNCENGMFREHDYSNANRKGFNSGHSIRSRRR
ncbi:hypothetical protein OIY81_2274 [Cryptosporidium canis]|nr:hypothetical protein OIY81_2274 [Cryptosporidium canis]